MHGVQTKLAIRMLELHEAAGEGGADVGAHLSALQTPEYRIDVIRADWDAEMAEPSACSTRSCGLGPTPRCVGTTPTKCRAPGR